MWHCVGWGWSQSKIRNNHLRINLRCFLSLHPSPTVSLLPNPVLQDKTRQDKTSETCTGELIYTARIPGELIYTTHKVTALDFKLLQVNYSKPTTWDTQTQTYCIRHISWQLKLFWTLSWTCFQECSQVEQGKWAAWLGEGLQRKEKHGEKINLLDFAQDLRVKVMGTLDYVWIFLHNLFPRKNFAAG